MQHKRIIAHKKTVVADRPSLRGVGPAPYVSGTTTMQMPNRGGNTDELGDYDPDGLGGADDGGSMFG